MTSRRSHKKSRSGCRTCKSRRVKCDERGPPCGNCASRFIKCNYTLEKSRQRLTPSENDLESQLIAPTTGLDSSSSRRLLELKLMHQWSTSTYKSYCGTLEDEYYNWQVVIPRMAFKHDYLLHGLFAMSALEIAALAESESLSEYGSIALQYQEQASRGLREKLSVADLSNITQEEHQALWALSSILMVLALTLPRFTLESGENYSMLDHILTYLEFMKGLVAVVLTRLSSPQDDPLLCKYKAWDELTAKPLEPPVRSALDRLIEINEEQFGALRVEHHTAELDALGYHAAYRKAIFYLEECYAKCSEPDTRGYGLGWLLMSGEDYILAVRNREPLALLILTHWGVLVEKSSHGVWWAQRVGRKLVEDLSIVLALDATIIDKFKHGLLWAREQVGLEDKI